jgi:hypothetical protein
MKLPIIKENCGFVNRIGYSGFSFGIWILFARGVKVSPSLIRHETIHYRQQKEMLFVFLWIFYGVEYLVKRFKYKTHDDAYRNLSFEREAYANDDNADYLEQRKPFAWIKYLR